MEAHEPCVCGRLRRASRALSRVYDEALEPFGLTVTQFAILRTLSRLDKPMLGELARETAHEKSGLWRTLRPMIREGWIEAETAREGQRLSISDAGMFKLVRALPAWREAQGRVDKALGPRARALVDLLQEIETRV
ncbi:MarR family winged helix-turn-helix transcriptional regulator [Brevundimonas sp.]|uniref:MarR family winged helix-turn-helix transcriptional regulator n=1 Tax=Brevundimonas sp. TaxID=1871086 RepID=UPI0025EB5444|nr:MarR family winged helix-turn-helix transcriptional regulator [Brevundimonas sp.]